MTLYNLMFPNLGFLVCECNIATGSTLLFCRLSKILYFKTSALPGILKALKYSRKISWWWDEVICPFTCQKLTLVVSFFINKKERARKGVSMDWWPGYQILKRVAHLERTQNSKYIHPPSVELSNFPPEIALKAFKWVKDVFV